MLTIHFKRSMISSLYIFIYSSSIYNSWKRISYILAQSCSKNSLSRMDGTHGELLLIISSLSCQLQCASRFCNKPYQWQYIGMRRNTNTTLFHLTLLLRYFSIHYHFVRIFAKSFDKQNTLRIVRVFLKIRNLFL